MLHKSFKSGKCKTSLKLAVARIKLLKNKREAQVKQLRRELAQLLETGQEKTARIRVEHVVREEKTMAAYDLLDLYCELIVARLPIIESQKSCPIDLKEAIASVIFAAPRCADIPELLDVRKHFTAKYGKEFVTSALELRPDCGVSRMMVEKLSAKAPDGQTKIKILTAIAQEHKVDWDPALVDNDLKPAEDLLNGPSTFETASRMTVKPPDVRLSPEPGQKYESSTNLPDHNVSISSLGSQVSASTETSNYTRMTSTSSPEPRASERRTVGQDYGHPSSTDENTFPPNRQYWNMEFKDATSAAQAAAESAERASMAARAAAELSSRGNNMRQYSTESNNSSVYGVRNKGSRTSGQKSQEPDTMDSAEVVQDSPESSSEIVNRRMQNQPRDRKETLPGVGEEKFGAEASVKRIPSESLSSDSSIASLDDEPSVISSQKADTYYEKRSSTVESIGPSWRGGNPERADYVDEESLKRRSSQSAVESIYHQAQNERSGHTDNSADGRARKQSSRSSSSRASGDGDHDDVMSNEDLKYWNDVDDNSLFSNGRGNVRVGAEQSVVFDEYGSDDDYSSNLGPKYNGHESSFYCPSPARELPSHLATDKNAWNPRENRAEFLEKKPTAEELFVTDPEPPFKSSVEQTKFGVPSLSDDLAPVAFDDSDGLSSESEDDLHIRVKTGSSSGLHAQNSFPRSPSSSRNDWNHSSTASSMKNEVTAMDKNVISQLGRNQEVELDSSEKYGFTDMSTYQSSPGQRKSMKKSDKSAQEPFRKPVDEEQPLQSSSAKEIKAEENPSTLESDYIMNSESEQGLNFRKLTGGIRNKGYQHPPYNRAPLGNTSRLSRNQSTEDTPTSIEQSSVTPMRMTPLGSGIRNQGPYNQKMHTKARKESSSIASKAFLDSDSDDANEEAPRQTVGIDRPSVSPMKKTPLGSGIHNQEPYNQKMHTEPRKKSSSIAAKSVLESDSDDSNEEPTRQPVGRSNMGSTLSRRTKDFPKQSQTSTPPKRTYGSEVEITPDSGMGRNAFRSSPAAELVGNPQSEMMRSGGKEDSKLSATNTPVQQKPSKPIVESRSSVHQESSKFTQRSSTVDQSSNVSKTLPQTASSGSNGSSNTSSMSEGSTSKENSMKKEGHVHPKLPDYEILAAHFHSLRANRRGA